MLYTRKGDDGTTSFFDSKADRHAAPVKKVQASLPSVPAHAGQAGKRAKKSSLRAEALGACDEINSLLGLCKVKAGNARFTIKTKKWHARNILDFVQQGMFIVQAQLAGAEKHFSEEKVEYMEAAIDAMEAEMPPIASFFVSGGTELGALFDFARTVARRAERRIHAASDAGEVKVEPAARQFMNRLSSLLYAFARYANFRAGVAERPPTYQ